MATLTKKAKIDSAMADGAKRTTSKVSTTAAGAKRPCPYGASCYRKNPLHFAEFSHDGDPAVTVDSTARTSASVLPSATDSVAGKPVADSSSSLPACKYGAKCYRKNLLHFAEYSHPTVGPTSAPAEPDDDGSDTDIYDSDEEDDNVKKKDGKKDGKGGDILNRGMSLVKSFSQMTEQERKELIQKAFEAKQQLQKELEATRKKVEEKDKELHKLQEEVNKGLMLVEGEEEALKGNKTVYFSLYAERDYKEGSADQTHFRLAESQFYRLLSGTHSYRISKVDYVVTPDLVKRFKAARENIRKERGEEFSYPVLAFHGTDTKNIVPICENGFKVPGESGFHHKTDTGWYGAGVYFSEYPDYSMGYINGATCLLLCQVLPGKVFECKNLIHGSSLTKGYDSHMSPCKKELVIFNSHHILPCYRVHYGSATGEFKYKDNPKTKIPAVPAIPTTEALKTKKTKAQKARASSVLDGVTIKYVGPKDEETAMYKLIIKHEGVKGTNNKFDILVAHEDKNVGNCKVIQTALNKHLPVVTAEYIYETILQKTDIDSDHYRHSS